MTQFEQQLLNELNRIRSIFANRDCPDMTVSICASGRCDSELKITFSVDSLYDTAVEGSSLDACVEEFFRRKGWKKANDFLSLPNLSQTPKSRDDDEIPF